MATNTTTTLSAEYQTLYDDMLLLQQEETRQLMKLGEDNVLGINKGAKAVSWFRFNNVDSSGVSEVSSEGTDPTTAMDLTLTQVTATLKQFACKVVRTDILDETEKFDSDLQAVKQVGLALGYKADEIIRNTLVTSTYTGSSGATSGITERYAAGTTNFAGISAAATTSAFPDQQDVLDMVTNLIGVNKGKPYEGGDIFCVTAHEVMRDLMFDSSWQDSARYQDYTKIEKGEFGRMHGVRFLKSHSTFREANSTQYVYSASGAIYSMLFLCKQAFGKVELASQKATKPKTYILNEPDKYDQLNLLRVVSGKFMFMSKLLNGNLAGNLRCKTRYV